MKKTSLKEKLLLIAFGIFLALILLEIGLRMAGIFVLYLQDRHNHLSFDPHEYRILCLGESTTALGGEDSYPSQLEAMLNAQSHGTKFTVINKGIISTTTEYILAHLDQNLDRYKPQLVIVMMGINDKAYLHDFNKTWWWENLKAYLEDFRIYKLFHLIDEHLTHRRQKINDAVETNDLSPGNDAPIENSLRAIIIQCIEQFHEHLNASVQYQQQGRWLQAQQEEQYAKQFVLKASLLCVELARRYRLQGSVPEAESMLKQATMLDPKDSIVYQEWGEFYLAQQKTKEALQAFELALALDPQNTDVLPSLARAYHQGHQDEAFSIYARYLQINPSDYWGHIELAQWLQEASHDELAKEYLNEAIKYSPGIDQAYIDMGKIFNKEGRQDLAQGYLQQAAGHKEDEYLPVTLVNYSLLLDKILNHHIKVVVMQYPLRDMQPLKDYLGQRKGVTYVENKQNFKQALTRQVYSYYFKDNFAYNFGHCTREGNELIARHLAQVISKE